MNIILAETAGFCFGVNRAIETINEVLEKSVDRIYTIGPVIHNMQLVKKLENRGVKVINKISEAEAPANIVIRAHGVKPEVYLEIVNNKMTTVDVTCPYVKKIHNLVQQKYLEGYQIIIIGDKDHPEVQGINGWCVDSAIIVENIDQIENIFNTQSKYCVVAQTTITKEKWLELTEYMDKKFNNMIKFDTICSATYKRQHEGAELAKKADMMIVIGGNKSSNTQKLYEMCKKYCENTYKIETVGELPPIDIKKIKNIGITAGASTPDWIIKEVISKMEELNRMENEVSFKEAFEESLVTIRSGSIIKGRILSFTNTEIFVDLGFKSDGIIAIEDYTEDPDFVPQKSLKAGDEIDAYVIKVDDREGTVKLSRKVIETKKKWDDLKNAWSNGTVLEAEIKETVKGGVIALYNGIRVFIPASQISDRYVKDLEEFLNTKADFKIIEFDRKKGNIKGSCKAVIEERKKLEKEKIWDTMEEGKIYKGKVTSLMDFGVFVDIGGVDGLIHINELSWNKIKHPSEVVKKGDVVEVKILEFNREKERIALGYKKNEDNPWNKAEEKYKPGTIIKGKIVRILPFGAFVELERGIDGMVHISQISNKRLVKPDIVLQIGQEVEAKVTDINTEKQKIGLSIKAVNPIDPPKTEEEIKKEEREKRLEEISRQREEQEKQEQEKQRLEREKIRQEKLEREREERLIPKKHVEEMSITLGDIFNGIDIGAHLGLHTINSETETENEENKSKKTKNLKIEENKTKLVEINTIEEDNEKEAENTQKGVIISSGKEINNKNTKIKKDLEKISEKLTEEGVDKKRNPGRKKKETQQIDQVSLEEIKIEPEKSSTPKTLVKKKKLTDENN